MDDQDKTRGELAEEIAYLRGWVSELERVKKALQESEEKYRLIFSKERDAIIVTDEETDEILDINESCERLYGYIREDMLKMKALDLSAEPEKSLLPLRQDVQPDGIMVPSRWHKKMDGTAFPVEISSSPFGWKGKKVICSLIRDITDRKKTEDELREKERLLQSILSASPVGIGLTENRKIKWVNQAWKEMFGFEKQEYLDQDASIVYPSQEEYKRVGRELYPNLSLAYVTQTDARFMRQDGSVFKGHIRMKALHPYDPAKGTIAAITDISERKQAEEELNERERFLSSIFLSIQDGISVLGKDLTIIRVNPTMERWYSHAMPLTGQKCHEAYHGISHPCQVCPTLQTLRTGQMAHEVVPRKGPQGVITGWLDLYSFPLMDAATGEIRGIIEYVRDISERKRSEERLQFEKERFEMLAQNAPFGMLMVSEKGDFEYVNPRFEEIFGYDLSEVRNGREWFQRACPDPTYRKEVIGAWIDDLQGHGPGETRPRVFTVTCKDGSEKIISFRPVRLGKGQDLVTCEDITERKQAEQALRESEQRLRLAWETTPDALSISRLKDGVYVEVSEGYSFLIGYESAEILGRSALDIGFWADPADRSSFVAILEKDGHVRNFQTRFRRKDGQERATLISAGLMTLEGEPHLFAVTKDIEDLKRTEVALRESEEKYRALFEESKDAVFMTTREGILLDANQAFLDLFGLGREEASNMAIMQIYTDAADRRRFQEEIERKGSIKDYAISFRKKDGSEIDCLLTSSVRRDKGGTIIGYQGIIRDVTDFKQIQGQLLQAQKMEAIGTLAGGIAHDFNNLLQAILGYTDLLLIRKKVDDPDRQKLEIVRQAARDGADLVSRILTFSMKAEFRACPTDLNQEIRRVEELLCRTVPRMIKIDLVLADDLWVVDADSAQIEQVILNLAVNAQHAMPDGGRLVIETSNVLLEDDYVRKHWKAKPGRYVLLTVSDTGVGMKPEIVDRIFEPFFTTKTDGEGTGLGLAMVHGIVSRHGGYIRCYSEPNRGTSFEIYLPVSASDQLSDVTLTREMPALGTETILLVDDDDRIREMGRQIIEMGGYQVLTARSGEEALVMYAAHAQEIALVILDLIMPGMGGNRCLQKLLLIDPDVKVIVASGYSSSGLTIDEAGTGARGFIKKPYDVKDILASIRQVLDGGRP